MKSDEELKKIAEDMHAGRIYSDRHCARPEDARSVFMILSLMEPKHLKEMIDKGVNFVYEYLDKAGPMSVNGMPTFLSCQMLVKEETTKMLEYYEKIKAAVEAVQ